MTELKRYEEDDKRSGQGTNICIDCLGPKKKKQSIRCKRCSVKVKQRVERLLENSRNHYKNKESRERRALAIKSAYQNPESKKRLKESMDLVWERYWASPLFQWARSQTIKQSQKHRASHRSDEYHYKTSGSKVVIGEAVTGVDTGAVFLQRLRNQSEGETKIPAKTQIVIPKNAGLATMSTT
jgi:hypothetical protein